MHPSPRRFVPHVIILSVLLVALASGVAMAALTPLPDGANDFNSPGFVVRHVWLKFAYLASPFRSDLSEAQKTERVARYFELNGEIAAKEQEAGDSRTPPDVVAHDEQDLARLRAERESIQNSVQVILEGRLNRVIKEAGLTRHIGEDVVWPPPDIEFQHPPEVLVTSPRDRIEIENETLLSGDLGIERIEEIERKAEADGKTSAAVIEIGGIAMYPAIIPETDDYAFTMSDIAHEWTHHYLYFTPLGRRYFEGGDLTTLNETVANIVGQALGDMLLKEYPLPAKPQQTPSASATPQASPTPAPQTEQVDFNKTMHDLRLRVEDLLKQGNIDEAERQMEDTRRFLADHGYYIRKINQAYFAFQGSYADTPGSIDPIGPKLATLRQESGSLQEFVRRAQDLTSASDLDQALASASAR